MSFWTDGKIEPKKTNRWVIQFDGVFNGNMYFATKVSRPAVEIANKEHKYLNHTFNYPGRASWKPITCTMVDTAGSGEVGDLQNAGINTMGNLMSILAKAGYIVPDNDAALNTISKKKAVSALSGPSGDTSAASAAAANGIVISMVSAEGVTVEKWTLKNAFISKFTPGELSYEADDLATVDIEIIYDYCEFQTSVNGDPFFKPGLPTF